jgi:hypothetical protein
MLQITEYKFVCAITPIELTELVNTHIKDGWQPFGNAIMSRTINTFINPQSKTPPFEVHCIAQAMVKYESLK